MEMVWKVALGLVVVWLAFVVIGFVVKALFWLAVVGVLALGATAAVSWAKGGRKQIR